MHVHDLCLRIARECPVDVNANARPEQGIYQQWQISYYWLRATKSDTSKNDHSAMYISWGQRLLSRWTLLVVPVVLSWRTTWVGLQMFSNGAALVSPWQLPCRAALVGTLLQRIRGSRIGVVEGLVIRGQGAWLGWEGASQRCYVGSLRYPVVERLGLSMFGR